MDFYIVKTNIKGKKYHDLLAFLFEEADYFELVERHDVGLDDYSLTLKNQLAPYLLGTQDSNEWAAQMTEKLFPVNHYNATPEAKQILLDNSKTIYDFGLKYALEDLSFYRKEEVYFVTVGHEKECGFVLATERDLEYVKQQMPHLRLRLS